MCNLILLPLGVFPKFSIFFYCIWDSELTILPFTCINWLFYGSSKKTENQLTDSNKIPLSPRPCPVPSRRTVASISKPQSRSLQRRPSFAKPPAKNPRVFASLVAMGSKKWSPRHHATPAGGEVTSDVGVPTGAAPVRMVPKPPDVASFLTKVYDMVSNLATDAERLSGTRSRSGQREDDASSGITRRWCVQRTSSLIHASEG